MRVHGTIYLYIILITLIANAKIENVREKNWNMNDGNLDGIRDKCLWKIGRHDWKVDLKCARKLDNNEVARVDIGWEYKYYWTATQKIANKKIKIINGNGRKSLNLLHWNMGSRFWRNKVDEIRQTIMEKSPDIFAITEAYLFTSDPLESRHIEGYEEYLPITSQGNERCRLVVLVKEGINVKLRADLMDNKTASIWFQLSRSRRKKLLVGTIYRQHTLLDCEDQAKDKISQTARWKNFLDQWKKAEAEGDTIVIGDTNLDYVKWDSPTNTCSQMVSDTKLEMETRGFYQLIRGITRSLKGQQDSALDHLWTNIPEIIIATMNISRASSDHNMIGASVRLKGGEVTSQEFYKRDRKNFDLTSYRKKLTSSRWEEFYSLQEINEASNWLEARISDILQEESPIKIVQPNKKFKSWISKQTIELFKQRDMSREKAKMTGEENDWKIFKTLRNRATNKMRQDKKVHFDN